MTGYSLTFEEKGNLLHVVVEGRNSRENTIAYLEDIVVECSRRHCPYVLIEERLVGPRLSAFDVFDIASRQGRPLVEPFRAIAFVDVDADGNMMKFAEDVAVNRGIPVRTFASVGEAERWLESRSLANE
jgi:hypothetical protein